MVAGGGFHDDGCGANAIDTLAGALAKRQFSSSGGGVGFWGVGWWFCYFLRSFPGIRGLERRLVWRVLIFGAGRVLLLP